MRKYYDMMGDGSTGAYKDIDGDWVEYYKPNRKDIDVIKENAIGFAHWKDRHFKRTYPYTGYFYCLSDYGSVKLIPGVLYGEHYSFEQLYDLYIVSQK